MLQCCEAIEKSKSRAMPSRFKASSVGRFLSLLVRCLGRDARRCPKIHKISGRSAACAFSLTPRLANTWVSQLMQVQGMSEDSLLVTASLTMVSKNG